MKFQFDDGGRASAGFTGIAGDCVTRSVAIATGIPYQEVYEAMSKVNAGFRSNKRASFGKRTARSGIAVRSKAFRDYMNSIGWYYTPTMGIGTGCKVHLRADELPKGRLIVQVSKHMTAVIDGVIHDTHDPQRLPFGNETDAEDIHGTRCVYGYWSKP